MKVPKYVMITGANRGIGLAFIKEMLIEWKECKIIATVRNLDNCKDLDQLSMDRGNIFILKLDLLSDIDIKNVASKVSDIVKDDGLNLLINNAGYIFQQETNLPRNHGIPSSMAIENRVEFMQTFETNCVGPFMLSRVFALTPILTKAIAKNCSYPNYNSVIVNIGSILGSISENKSGGTISYRVSKTGLNMITKCLSLELIDHRIITVTVCPPWSKTRIGGIHALIPVSETAKCLLNVIKNIKTSDNGTVINYDGRVLEW